MHKKGLSKRIMLAAHPGNDLYTDSGPFLPGHLKIINCESNEEYISSL